KCLIYQLAETIFVISQHLCSLFKCQTLRAVAAVIRNMTGSLVRQQFDLNIIVYCILQKVYNISMVRNRNGFFLTHVFLRNSEGFCGIFNYQAYPSLVMACLDPGSIYLCNDTNASCNFNGFWLSAAHAAKTAGNEQMSCQVSVLRYAQEFTSCVQNCIKCTMNDSLWSDVHPAAGCHLPIGRAAHCCSFCPVLRIIKHTDHKTICNNNSWAGFMRF